METTMLNTKIEWEICITIRPGQIVINLSLILSVNWIVLKEEKRAVSFIRLIINHTRTRNPSCKKNESIKFNLFRWFYVCFFCKLAAFFSSATTTTLKRCAFVCTVDFSISFVDFVGSVVDSLRCFFSTIFRFQIELFKHSFGIPQHENTRSGKSDVYVSVSVSMG